MDQQVKQYKKQLQNIYKPQAQILREQYQAQLPQFKAEEESLKQAKKNAFRDITNDAVGRGGLWSGIVPHEEAQYVGEEYLPALAGVSQQRNQARRDLKSALLGLQTEQRTSLMDFRETLRQEQLEQRRLREQREFQAQQAALDRQLTRGGAGYSGGGGSSDEDTYSQDVSSLANELKAVAGSDGYVSPSSYAQGKRAWVQAGYSSEDYDEIFAGYRNPENQWYNVGGQFSGG